MTCLPRHKGILQDITFGVWSWLSSKHSGFNFSYGQWASNPNACLNG